MRCAPILMYHSIGECATRFRPFTLSPTRFRDHLRVLSDEGYSVVSVSDLLATSGDGHLTDVRTVGLTFDDGFRDFASVAAPMLIDRGFGATAFITTGHIGGTSRWLAPEGEGKRPMMTWREVTEVASGGIEIGAHTHTHPQLDLVSRSRVSSELSRSKSELENAVGRAVDAFAYPYGYLNRAVRQAAVDAGFRSACAVRDLPYRSTDDLFCIPRLTITDQTDAKALRLLLRGSRSWRDDGRSRARAMASYGLRRAHLKKRRSRTPEELAPGIWWVDMG